MILWSILIAATILYRILCPFVDGLLNFSPVMALAFCAAIYTGRKSAVLFPLLALAISDIILNLHFGVAAFNVSSLAAYACYIVAAAMGVWVSQHKNWINIFTGTLASALLFYLVTNSLCWLDNPVYAKTFAGWVQALTTGQPGFPPTIVFFRNSLVGDLIFTGVFVSCMEFAAQRAGRISLFQKAHSAV
ncbi:MAG: hypothetical protein LBH01_07835 [Verrucomicrobiales bacterium]|jgi:hypothetical protein|nr:hypothetical protein [Verrucomicrobiales bacterium]